MADEGNVKTPLDALQDTLSRLKEMAHYSQMNIEKLAALWLEVPSGCRLSIAHLLHFVGNGFAILRVVADLSNRNRIWRRVRATCGN